MVAIDEQTDGDAQVFKIVVTGPFSAGKTTMISAISEIPVVLTEVPTTDSSEVVVKGTTTVSMDFGKYTVPGELPVELLMFGTPGQERFRFMWDVLARGSDGNLLVVDGTEPRTWGDAEAIARHFRRVTSAPLVVGANRIDDPGDPTIEALRSRLAIGDDVPIVPCQLIELGSVKTLLLELLVRILEHLDGPRPGVVTDPAH